MLHTCSLQRARLNFVKQNAVRPSSERMAIPHQVVCLASAILAARRPHMLPCGQMVHTMRHSMRHWPGTLTAATRRCHSAAQVAVWRIHPLVPHEWYWWQPCGPATRQVVHPPRGRHRRRRPCPPARGDTGRKRAALDSAPSVLRCVAVFLVWLCKVIYGGRAPRGDVTQRPPAQGGVSRDRPV